MLDEEGPTIECITALRRDSACYWPTSIGSTAQAARRSLDGERANGNAVSFDGQGTAEICLQWDEGPFGEVASLTGCPGVCDPIFQIPIISSSTLVTDPRSLCG